MKLQLLTAFIGLCSGLLLFGGTTSAFRQLELQDRGTRFGGLQLFDGSGEVSARFTLCIQFLFDAPSSAASDAAALFRVVNSSSLTETASCA